ncbi:MAG: hypothetical protein MUC62_10440, partial [Candidatus Thermoplasmatota archaeon]|nr:hypothetical protein [Candidatus Thermoplasmatota archaeon]
MMKSTMITAVLVLLMLAVPGSIATIGAQDQGAVAPGTEDVLQGEIVSTTDDVKIEKVDSSSLTSILYKVQMPKLEGTLEQVKDRATSPSIVGANDKLQVMAQRQGFQPARQPISFMETEATRGTDKEPDRDPFNGSKLASSDSVTGTLDFRATDPQGTLGDYIDWYKMEFKGIDPTVPGSSKNVTFELTNFDSADTTLYETTFDSTQYTTDYLDFMDLYILYDAPFWGFDQLGGMKFYYDDGDDTDGWVYDGGSTNPDWQDNWTANFETPGNSFGTEDTNGGLGGLTEDGWYYLGVSFNYYVTPTAAERPDFIIDYSFTVSTASDTNNFPNSPSTTAGAPNDFNNATATKPTMPGRTHSGLNFYDWYRFDGVNQDYIWNMSVWVNVTRTGWSMDEVAINDNWMYIMLLWWGAGEDGKYDTEDDIWTITFKILFYAVYFVDDQGNPVSYMQERFTQAGGNNMQVNVFNVNNRTDATPGHPYLNGDARQMFIGLYSEPQMFQQTQAGGLAQVFPDFQAWDQYNIEWSVSEVKPNTAPVVSNIDVTAKHPAEVYINDPTGGYYETEFTIQATYTDENGDLPQKMYVIFDGKENKPVEIQDFEVNSLDTDVTDGKDFKMTITGETLTDFPYPHSIKV